MNSVVQREDYSWYGDEGVGRTRKHRQNTKEIGTNTENNSHVFATTTAIMGILLCMIECMIEYMITK